MDEKRAKEIQAIDKNKFLSLFPSEIYNRRLLNPALEIRETESNHDAQLIVMRL